MEVFYRYKLVVAMISTVFVLMFLKILDYIDVYFPHNTIVYILYFFIIVFVIIPVSFVMSLKLIDIIKKLGI
ncbi:MAG: hypothetical protein FH751_14265 [Firmicutes bacterium]|nr:hypothetical protein [Bacillota bacterium]